MNLTERTKKLKSLFSFAGNNVVEDSRIEMIPFSFTQQVGNNDIEVLQHITPLMDFCPLNDNGVAENKQFSYMVFNPYRMRNSSRAILLIHGLNERCWDKYLTWAEDLAKRCNVPVILFPIAFHMNRTPSLWYTPRQILPWALKRKETNTSFANVALSTRLSDYPLRFYVSGRESLFNIMQLAYDIKEGKNELFSKNCIIDIFAYSIGALLSQITLMANPDQLFSKSKLFIFCGGSIFEDMNGRAKDIMDNEAYDVIYDYYRTTFMKSNGDYIQSSFQTMILENELKERRESFYSANKDRVRIVGLTQDSVIPIGGVYKAVGTKNSEIVKELDFPYKYTHQTPFPNAGNVDSELVYENFRSVFDMAETFY